MLIKGLKVVIKKDKSKRMFVKEFYLGGNFLVVFFEKVLVLYNNIFFYKMIVNWFLWYLLL